MLGYLVGSILIFGHILLCAGRVADAPASSATLADVGTLTWVMAFLGERAAPLFLVYVWITLANGFRFGARYLLLSLAHQRRRHRDCCCGRASSGATTSVLGIGLLIGFIALSFYVRSLVTKLFDAVARAEAANQAKRRFISVVSHEMRTPLNAIIGMADLMRDTTLSREQADMLQTLRGSSQVMLGLVEDVLDFSKIEAGKLVLERTDFDLHALVNSTSRILQAQAQAKSIEFVVSIMPEVPPALRGDAHHLRQVLINLAGNAVKFTERGSVTVHVSLQEETDAAVRAEVLGARHRRRHPAGGAAAHLRELHAGRPVHHAPLRRHGPGHHHRQAAGRADGRQDRPGERGRPGQHVLVRDRAGQAARARRRRRGRARRRARAAGGLSGGARAAGRAVARGLGRGAGARRARSRRAATASSPTSRSPSPTTACCCTRSAATRSWRGASAAWRRNPLPPLVLAAPREADVQRFAALSGGFGAVLELPFDKRQLFHVLHAISSADEVREGVVRLQDYAKRDQGARRLSVLVADDNPTNREVLGRILERAGHATTLVADGDLALDAMEAGQFDIVLLDRNMPGLSGLETLQAIRLMTRGRERLPVVMLSADVTLEAKKECLEAGADSFIPKPVEALRLLDELRNLTAGKGKEAERAVASAQRGVRAARRCGAPKRPARRRSRTWRSWARRRDFLERLIGVFIADSRSLLAKMEASVAARNFGEFRAHLHAMKGSAASIGTERLTRLCATLGKYSDAELRLQSAGLMRSLNEEFELGRAALERYVQEKRSRSAS